ncbi:hypothetical protein [Marinobacter sp. R17]|uniref:hypothetical protein n=1 Tax=Marinobacter sp. R17 TaxID=2484250 RepID=UPI000F4D09F1|nr:hypothetical protein [Marinobacter sp. R17]
MRSKGFLKTTAPLFCLLFSQFSMAAGNTTLYAVYEYLLPGPKGTLQMTQVGITKDGKKACNTILRGLKEGQRRSRSANRVRIKSSKCLPELPDNLKGITNLTPLKDGYYIHRTVRSGSAKFVFIDVMLGVERFYPENTCSVLENMYKKKYPDAVCVGPRKELIFLSDNGKQAKTEKTKCVDGFPLQRKTFDRTHLCQYGVLNCKKSSSKHGSSAVVYCDLESEEACNRKRKWKTAQQYVGIDNNLEFVKTSQNMNINNGKTIKKFCLTYND